MINILFSMQLRNVSYWSIYALAQFSYSVCCQCIILSYLTSALFIFSASFHSTFNALLLLLNVMNLWFLFYQLPFFKDNGHRRNKGHLQYINCMTPDTSRNSSTWQNSVANCECRRLKILAEQTWTRANFLLHNLQPYSCDENIIFIKHLTFNYSLKTIYVINIVHI